MDRFLKRSALGDKSPGPAKKSKSYAKQGNISAAFSALEFKVYFYDSGENNVLQVMHRRRG